MFLKMIFFNRIFLNSFFYYYLNVSLSLAHTYLLWELGGSWWFDFNFLSVSPRLLLFTF